MAEDDDAPSPVTELLRLRSRWLTELGLHPDLQPVVDKVVGLNLAMQHLQVSETHPRFGKMWPGIKTLAKESGVGQSTARRSLHRLIALKFLGAQQGHGGRRQGKEGYDVSLYWLLDPSGVVRALPADRAYPVR